MKYIMFEIEMGEITKKIPIIFPPELVHAGVAKYMGNLISRTIIPPKVISAGTCDIIECNCYGESETLKLRAGKADTRTIECYDYFHGTS